MVSAPPLMLRHGLLMLDSNAIIVKEEAETYDMSGAHAECKTVVTCHYVIFKKAKDTSPYIYISIYKSVYGATAVVRKLKLKYNYSTSHTIYSHCQLVKYHSLIRGPELQTITL